MNLFGLSPGELILISFVALIVLGPEKLPEVAGSLGKWVREFRRATEELTAQFTAENPLAELQRAFSLEDEPVESPDAAEEVVEEAAVADSAWEGASDATQLASPPSVPSSTPSVPNYYFTMPSLTAGIAPEWTHGSPVAVARRHFKHVAVVDAIGDQWAHGVPVPTLRVVEPQESLDDSEEVNAESETVSSAVGALPDADGTLLEDTESRGEVSGEGFEVDENQTVEPGETVRNAVEEDSSTVESAVEPHEADDETGEAAASTPALVEEVNGKVEADLPRIHPNGTDKHESDPIPAAAGDSREGHRQ